MLIRHQWISALTGPFLFYRAVPVVRPGAGGCSLSFRWRIEPSSRSWPWPRSRTASLPFAGSSSLSRARGHGDFPAALKSNRNCSDFYAVQRLSHSCVLLLVYLLSHSTLTLVHPPRCSFLYQASSMSLQWIALGGPGCRHEGRPGRSSECLSFHPAVLVAVSPHWTNEAVRHLWTSDLWPLVLVGPSCCSSI